MFCVSQSISDICVFCQYSDIENDLNGILKFSFNLILNNLHIPIAISVYALKFKYISIVNTTLAITMVILLNSDPGWLKTASVIAVKLSARTSFFASPNRILFVPEYIFDQLKLLFILNFSISDDVKIGPEINLGNRIFEIKICWNVKFCVDLLIDVNNIPMFCNP